MRAHAVGDCLSRACAEQRDTCTLATSLGLDEDVFEVERGSSAERRVGEEVDRVAENLTIDLGQQGAEARRLGQGIAGQTLACRGVWPRQLFIIGERVDQLQQPRGVRGPQRADHHAHGVVFRSRMTRPAGGLGWKYVDFSGMRSRASATASTPLTGVGFRKNAAEARPWRTAANASCGSRV